MLEEDQEMFAVSYDKCSTFHTAILKRWYIWAKPLVCQSIKDADDFGKKFC